MEVVNKTFLSSFRLSNNKVEYFRKLNNAEKIFILHNSSKRNKEELFQNLTESEILEIASLLDPDEVTDVLQVLSSKKKKRILLKLNSAIKKKVDFLLKFSPRSAAGIMSINYILVLSGTPIEEVIMRIKKHLELGKKEPTILVVNEERELLGELRISTLIIEKKPNLIYSKIKKLPIVRFDEDQSECIERFKEHKQEKMIVLDERENILGLIHARDIFKIIEEENTEDFYAIAGLQKEEDITDNAIDKVKYRFRWLFINLITAFLAAFVVSMFEDTLSKIVILAAFMPIVAGMGGNSGTQTVAIMVRSLALKRIDSKIGKRILLNEILAGIINGTLIGVLVGLIAVLYGESYMFGVVAGIAVLSNLVVASMFGTVTPLVLRTFGVDPASSSSVFVTTSTDVFGFLIFLGLATIILL